MEIEKGAVFRVVKAQDDEEEDGSGVAWLKTDDDYEGGWLMDTGIVGKLAGKKVVKRVAGSMAAQRRSAVLEISEIEKAEEVTPGSEGSGGDAEEQPPNDGGFQKGEEERAPILELLEDPMFVKLCQSMEIDVDDLKGNPEFLRAVARRLYGDEVVS